MQKVLILKGLIASGKTTYAKALLAGTISDENRLFRNWKRVNKDDLRTMLDDDSWNKNNETFIIEVRNDIISSALRSGYNVVVDDTNFNPNHEKTIRDIVKNYKNVFVEIKFFDTPLEECILRDSKRDKPVGEKVIRDMWEKYLKMKPAASLFYDPELPNIVIFDLDGTLAKMNGRGPFDWHRVGEDSVNEPIRFLFNSFTIDTRFVVSGRDGVCRKETEEWLARHGLHYSKLFMRAAGDNRKDAVIKKEIFDREINGKYNVIFVVDDRTQVVEMWRSLGITCLQCAEGNF